MYYAYYLLLLEIFYYKIIMIAWLIDDMYEFINILFFLSYLSH